MKRKIKLEDAQENEKNYKAQGHEDGNSSKDEKGYPFPAYGGLYYQLFLEPPKGLYNVNQEHQHDGRKNMHKICSGKKYGQEVQYVYEIVLNKLSNEQYQFYS